MAGRTLLPAFPKPRLLPWVLGAISLGALAYGLLAGSDSAAAIGAIGVFGVAVGYGLSTLVLGPVHGDPGANRSGGAPDDD